MRPEGVLARPQSLVRLIILGTGGSAFDVIDIVQACDTERHAWEIAGFLDDTRPVDSKHLGFRVLGRLHEAPHFADCLFINVIGSDISFRKRAEIIHSTGLPPDRFATLIHPQASVSQWATLGRGVYVSFGVSIAGAVSCADHVSFSAACVIGHDSKIGEAALIAPRAVISGFVEVGRCAYIGAGSMIRQKLKIGETALVGIGAVVTRDVPAGKVYVGNPGLELVYRGERNVES